MNSTDSNKLLLAASGGDTVKLFDISAESRDPCILFYAPSRGFRVNSVKWNHNNLVVVSAGEDKKISLWRKNGQSLGTVAVKTDTAEIIEESISTISFSNKGSRYLCSGGSGQVVRIWDLQKKRCVKWLRGHTDTITGAMYNCKDEHIASISRKGDLILHTLASGIKAAELRDPNRQVLGALDYSQISRHLLVTAGDDGSIHLWDTTGRNPKVSWLRQHSAPTSGVCFSPSNDKIIGSVGLDMKLYTFDSGSRKPSSCIAYEAPFSSLAFTDDGLTLAAGTSTGLVAFYDVRGKPQPIKVLHAYGNSEAIASLSWQRSKSVIVNETSCTDETVLLAGDVGDSILMPDPLPSMASSNPSTTSAISGSQNSTHSAETPLQSSSLTSGSLGRLLAPRRYNFKDDMEIFSPLLEFQPNTHSFDHLWDGSKGSKKEFDYNSSTHFSSGSPTLSREVGRDSRPTFDWKSSSTPKQDDISSTFSQSTSSTPATMLGDVTSSITPPEAWGGERLSDKLMQLRQSVNMPRFGTLTSDSLSSGSMLSRLHDVSLPTSTKDTTGPGKCDSLGPALSVPRRFSSYAERISATTSFNDLSIGSPKAKRSGVEMSEPISGSLSSRSNMSSSSNISLLPAPNDGVTQVPESSSNPDSKQENSFTLQLFQSTLEESLGSFQKSMHEDMRNLHIEILRQFHMQEMEISSVMKLILENQAEIMKEIQSLRKETQQLRQSL